MITSTDTMQIISHYTWINYNHDNKATISHIVVYDSVYDLILVPNLVAFISQKEEKHLFFYYHLLPRIVRKTVLMYFMQNIDMCLL